MRPKATVLERNCWRHNEQWVKYVTMQQKTSYGGYPRGSSLVLLGRVFLLCVLGLSPLSAELCSNLLKLALRILESSLLSIGPEHTQDVPKYRNQKRSKIKMSKFTKETWCQASGSSIASHSDTESTCRLAQHFGHSAARGTAQPTPPASRCF